MTDTHGPLRQVAACLWCGGKRAIRAGVYICPTCDGAALEQREQEVAE